MSEIRPTEIANQAIASAVTSVVQQDPEIDSAALDLIATKVAAAILKGFAVVSAAVARPVKGS